MLAWHPLDPGGASFGTYVLVRVSDDRLEFRPSLAARAVLWLCRLPALVFLIIAVAAAIEGEWTAVALITALAVGWLGLSALVFRILHVFAIRVFDRGESKFWHVHGRDRAHVAALEDIRALQLIDEVVEGESTFTSRELNLVLRDQSRRPVIDHGDLDAVVESAQTLAQWLGVPILRSPRR